MTGPDVHTRCARRGSGRSGTRLRLMRGCGRARVTACRMRNAPSRWESVRVAMVYSTNCGQRSGFGV